MLNRYNFINRSPETINKYVNIEEKRAPTDESVRLLKEMEAEARAKIIDSFNLQNNLIDGKIYVSRDCINKGFAVVLVVEINGKKEEFCLKVKDLYRYDTIRDEVLEDLYKQLSKRITLLLLRNNVKQL